MTTINNNDNAVNTVDTVDNAISEHAKALATVQRWGRCFHDDYGNLSSSKTVTIDILQLTALSPDAAIRAQTMQNPNATPEILMIGVKDSAPWVRLITVMNPNADESVLMTAATDSDEMVRKGVSLNKNVTDSVRIMLKLAN